VIDDPEFLDEVVAKLIDVDDPELFDVDGAELLGVDDAEYMDVDEAEFIWENDAGSLGVEELDMVEPEESEFFNEEFKVIDEAEFGSLEVESCKESCEAAGSESFDVDVTSIDDGGGDENCDVEAAACPPPVPPAAASAENALPPAGCEKVSMIL